MACLRGKQHRSTEQMLRNRRHQRRKMVQSVVALKRKMVSTDWCSVKGAINCVNLVEARQHHLLTRRFAVQWQKISQPCCCTGNASELWVDQSETGICSRQFVSKRPVTRSTGINRSASDTGSGSTKQRGMASGSSSKVFLFQKDVIFSCF